MSEDFGTHKLVQVESPGVETGLDLLQVQSRAQRLKTAWAEADTCDMPWSRTRLA